MCDFRLTAERPMGEAGSSASPYGVGMDPLVKLAQVPPRPPRSDVVTVGALAAWGVLEAVFGTGPGSTAARIGFGLVVTLPLLFRRRAPFAVALFISAASLAWALAADRPESGTFPFPSLLFAIFSVALYGRSTLTAVIGGLVPVGAMVGALSSDFNSGTMAVGNTAILTFFCTMAWTAGWLVRRRASQARQAYEESGGVARGEGAGERARIATELHDVVAHSVSIIAVQAGAAEQLLDSRPDAAREHLAAVRRTAREALTEMRRVLDVLRGDDATYAPQPGLSRLPDLIEEVTAAGVPVSLVEEGERSELPAGIDLVAFRVIQESLTNVRKHAGGAATQVALRYGATELDVEITNEAGRSHASLDGGGGHGLFGMRERVRLFGGRFQAGEQAGGGFRVHAQLPLEEVPT
jgi:signal transduction histidine kinase